MNQPYQGNQDPRQGMHVQGNVQPQGNQQWPPQQWPPRRQVQPYQGQWPPPQYPAQQQLPPVFPPGYQGQPNAQGWYPPPQRPQVMVTVKPITFAEHLFHFLMCFPTCGLWIFVWIARAAGKREEKTYYR